MPTSSTTTHKPRTYGRCRGASIPSPCISTRRDMRNTSNMATPSCSGHSCTGARIPHASWSARLRESWTTTPSTTTSPTRTAHALCERPSTTPAAVCCRRRCTATIIPTPTACCAFTIWSATRSSRSRWHASSSSSSEHPSAPSSAREAWACRWWCRSSSSSSTTW